MRRVVLGLWMQPVESIATLTLSWLGSKVLFLFLADIMGSKNAVYRNYFCLF
jgi:hypothetical protein